MVVDFSHPTKRLMTSQIIQVMFMVTQLITMVADSQIKCRYQESRRLNNLDHHSNLIVLLSTMYFITNFNCKTSIK